MMIPLTEMLLMGWIVGGLLVAAWMWQEHYDDIVEIGTELLQTLREHPTVMFIAAAIYALTVVLILALVLVIWPFMVLGEIGRQVQRLRRR